jgi:hypothetical protein
LQLASPIDGTYVQNTLYGSTKKHKTFDMLNYVQDMLIEEQQDMRVVKHTDLRFRGRIIKSGLGTRGV